MQCSCPWQVEQLTPPVPHWASVFAGSTQVLPEQHPDGQVDELQPPEPTHPPLIQFCPYEHPTHRPPSAPQAVLVLPTWQLFDTSRQPPQAALVQAWAWHVWVPRHAVHAPPLVPQAVLRFPALQSLPTQQPCEHVEGLHPVPASEPPSEAPVVRHTPSTQSWPEPQAWHVKAPVPHASAVLPAKHPCFSSQQPLQFDRRQRGVAFGPHDGNSATRNPTVVPSARALHFIVEFLSAL